MAYCGKCGTPLDVGAKFCPSCGTFQSGDTHINTNKKEITIGRSASCDISLGESAEFASTCHGTIFWNGTQLMYKDTSTNGTVINNTMIHGRTVPINHGDTILIAGKYNISWEQIDSLMSPSNISFQQTRLLKSHATICRTCGSQLNDGAGYCPSCGQSTSYLYPIQQFHASDSGCLVIRWDGKWALIDNKVQIFVNGIKQGEYSFKDGFEVVVPISSPEMVVETKLSFHKTKKVLFLNPQENYSYNLVYNTLSGSFGFVLCDNDGNELETDKLHWGYSLLCFLIPIVGIIYAICVWKKKPATSYTAICVSILGVIISLIVTSNLPPLSRFMHLPDNSVIEDDVELTSLTDDSDAKLMEDIRDVHSEAYIKYRLQHICDEIPSLSDETLVRRYFSESFKELYNAVVKEDEKEAQKGNIGFFDFEFWTGGQDGVLQSVTVIEVNKVAESEAKVTVQDLIKFGKNDESKSSKQIKLILENGNWYIDDVNSYHFRMDEFLKENEGDDEIKSQDELAQTDTAIRIVYVKGEDSERGWTELNKNFARNIRFNKVRVKHQGNDEWAYVCVKFSTRPNVIDSRDPYEINLYSCKIMDNTTELSGDDISFSRCKDVGNGWYEYTFSRYLYFSYAQENAKCNYVKVFIDEE